MATYISGHMGQFAYFDRQFGHPDWTGKKILDFGGNVGNLLYDPKCEVDPSDYWSMDVSEDAIFVGRRRHPKAHFVFFDRYSYEYNPTGRPGLPIPDPGARFDFVIGMSVITHTNQAESLEYIDQLMALLSGEGRLALTFIDPTWTPPQGWDLEPAYSRQWSNLRWMLEKLRQKDPQLDLDGMLTQAEKSEPTWMTLIGNESLILDPAIAAPPDENPCDVPPRHRQFGYINMCTASHMAELLPNAEILPPYDDRQHCLLLTARQGTGRRGTGRTA